MLENINCGDFIKCGRLSSLLWLVLNAISQKWYKHAILMRIRSVCSFHLIHPNVQEPFFYLANEWHKVHGEQAASMAEIA